MKSQNNSKHFKNDTRLISSIKLVFHLHLYIFSKTNVLKKYTIFYVNFCRSFQQFVGINPPTGQMNVQTTAQMIRKRCSNPDIVHQRTENIF